MIFSSLVWGTTALYSTAMARWASSLLSLALLLRGPGLAAGVDSVQEDTRSFQPLVSVGAVHGRSGAEMSGPQRVDGRDKAPTVGPTMVTSEVMSAMVRAGRVRLVPVEVVQRVPSGNGP